MTYPMDTEILVWADARRGIHSLLMGGELLGVELVPRTRVEPGDLDNLQTYTPVLLETRNTRTGEVDRVQEVQITVYGVAPYSVTDLAEAIQSFLCGTDVETPPGPISASGEPAWPEFYFDEIEPTTGVSQVDYPDSQISQAVFTVAAQSRPMS